MAIDASDLQARLETMVKEGDAPGAQLAVLSDGEVATAAAGVLNVRTGQPVTPDSIFQIGSASKIWTTTAVMQLVDEGKVALDVPVRTYLPDLRLGDEQMAATVTLRHLLTHTSGIEGDVLDDTGRNDDALTSYLGLLAGLDPVHALSETWSYCNAGFAIAARVLEVTDDSTFEQAMRSRLADKLGIARFAWNAGEAILHGAAVGHFRDPDNDTAAQVAPRYDLPRHGMAAGGIITSAADLVAFGGMHLAGGTAPNGTRVLSEESVRTMQQVQADCPAKDLADAWGVGWMLHDWDGRRVIGHGGGTIGQITSFYVVPDAGLAIALVVNGPRTRAEHALLTDLFADLAGLAFPRQPEPPASPPEVDATPFLGTYRRYGTALHIERGDDTGLQLRLQYEGAAAEFFGTSELPPTRLVAEDGDGTFLTQQQQWSDGWSKVRFYGGDPARPRFLHLGGRAAVRTG